MNSFSVDMQNKIVRRINESMAHAYTHREGDELLDLVAQVTTFNCMSVANLRMVIASLLCELYSLDKSCSPTTTHS